MAKKFDEYLNKGGFSKQDKEALESARDTIEDANQSPGDVQNSYTPNPKDAGKQDRAGQETTTKDAGQTLKDKGVESEAGMQTKDSLAKYDQLFEKTSKEPEQEPEL